ncbi:hypothetical protein M409DRAFT_23937 [Zasmidium cellare ATCC 36951]|uniref:Hydrophobin n=1 Tax=Zasmidium cellare ATCC 36951 TaxID=1080233 RepID=A0A6A6CEK7_ZASCE|nr:uncharacterized protein M409DRAFT_23937 [Zasmidium cellare ATCC 36951]KAF2165647.1 hypothetical protein M409DRAFT_23937 [Zasmidium cellare ATCC 36951]
MPSTIRILLAALPFLFAATAQDINVGNGISCIGDNACCGGTLRSDGNDISGAVCCPQDPSGSQIEGEGTTCATGTGVPLTAGVTITADSAAATGAAGSSSDMATSATTSAEQSSASASSSASSAASSASAATTSSGSGAAKTMAAMAPAAFGMGAMAVVFAGM